MNVCLARSVFDLNVCVGYFVCVLAKLLPVVPLLLYFRRRVNFSNCETYTESSEISISIETTLSFLKLFERSVHVGHLCGVVKNIVCL